MDEDALKLRCLELAIEQARKENPPDFRHFVAETQDWFYNRIKGEKPKTVGRQAKALLE